jgi:peptide/nickel transport system permease protein
MTTQTLLRFLMQRTASAVLLIWLAASGMLGLMRWAGGDFVSATALPSASREIILQERARLGLDQSFARYYAAWLGRVVRLDFGTSYQFDRPVTSVVIERAGNTALLAFAALALATLTGLPLGVIAGSGRAPNTARLVHAGSLVALSLPPLLTSLVFAWIAARTGWFPIGGIASAGAADLSFFARASDLAWHLVLPALALALPLTAQFERLQADAVSMVRAEPFILGAFARGVPASRVIWRDVWRPALGPVLSIYGFTAGQLLSGSLAVELVTAWPGLGRLMLDALGTRDVPLTVGCAAAAALFLSIWTAISDVTLASIDPRTHASIGAAGDAAA